MPQRTENDSESPLQLTAARFVVMTSDERAAAIQAMAQLLAHAQDRAALEGLHEDDVSLSAEPTSTTGGQPT